MDRFRRMILAASLGLMLVSVPAITLATTEVTYAVSGVEYAATTTVGSFAGIAVTTGDYGTWQATVVHNDPDPTKITGGTFALDGQVRDLAGYFAGGSLTPVTDSFCGKQTYNVSGNLILTRGGSGTATFTAVLTHYRIWLWNRCITYAATIKGSVTFSLT